MLVATQNSVVTDFELYLTPALVAPSPLCGEGMQNGSQRAFKSPLYAMERGFRGEVCHKHRNHVSLRPYQHAVPLLAHDIFHRVMQIVF